MIDANAVPAGRDLDAMIAERAFQWKRVEVGPDFDGRNRSVILTRDGVLENIFAYPPRGLLHLAYHVPQWSTEQNGFGLFNLIAELETRGWLVLMQRIRNSPGAMPALYWRVDLQRGTSAQRLQRATADAVSLPHAAALAALATAQ